MAAGIELTKETFPWAKLHGACPSAMRAHWPRGWKHIIPRGSPLRRMTSGHAIRHGSAGSGGQHVPLVAPHTLQLSEKGSGELRQSFINTPPDSMPK